MYLCLKKTVTKNQAKLFDKILVLVEEYKNLYSLRLTNNGNVSLHTLKRVRKSCTRSGRRNCICPRDQTVKNISSKINKNPGNIHSKTEIVQQKAP